MFLGCLSLLCGGLLHLSSIVSEHIASALLGSSLILMFVAIVNCCISFCSTDNSAASPKYGIWQRLLFAEVSNQRFREQFSVWKVQSGENGTIVEHVAKHGACSHGVVLGKVRSAPMLQKECGCCFSTFSGQDAIALLPCHHIFCEECILAWVTAAANRSQRCPMCRESYKFGTN